MTTTRSSRAALPAPFEKDRKALERYLVRRLAQGAPKRLADALRHAALAPGKRLRPLLVLLGYDAVGGDPAQRKRVMPAAAALEYVHAFSLVHDDLPALDDDDERRGRPSVHVAFGEAVALLAGDALLAEAFRLAASYDTPRVARELAGSTLGMIGGQYRDITGDDADLEELHRLKTGRLFVASVRLGLDVAEVPSDARAPWIAFGDDIGLLFQVVDDVIDADGYAERLGHDGASLLADEVADRARARLNAIDADTSVLGELVDALAVRTG